MRCRLRLLSLIFLSAVSVGCQTEECPPGVTDSIFCRGLLDATFDGCVPGEDCSPDGDPCAAGRMLCDLSGSRCEVIGRRTEGEPCGEGLACSTEGRCETCVPGAPCNTGNPCTTGATDCGAGVPVCRTTENLADDAECGTAGFCGGGECSECIEGSTCSTGNPCASGRMRCADDGTGTCEAVDDLPPGAGCGDGLACSEGGRCETCVPNATCSTGNPCTNGRTDCGSGSPVCLAVDEVDPGTSCGFGGFCSSAGECSECVEGTVCNTGNPCSSGVAECVDDVTICRAVGDLPAGVRCGAGLACDGEGNCSTCVPGDSCVTTACEVGTVDCSSGDPVCIPSGPAPAGAVCRERRDACDIAEVCDGSGAACPPDRFAPEGTDCIGGGTCDGDGTCVPPCVDGDPCDTGNLCEVGRVDCSTGVRVCEPVGPRDAGSLCRASRDACDAEEVCDGTAVTCPPDDPEPAGTTCPGGVCNGSGTCVECNPGEPCDAPLDCELGEIDCSSGGPVCVATDPAPAGTLCRAAADVCDAEEVCDGVARECPPDEYQTGTECRASTHSCDAAEVCPGDSIECPPDELAPIGTICPGGVCDEAGVCRECVQDAPCSTGNDCERGEIDCSGGSPVCVPQEVLAAGTECRASAGTCDVAEVCDGVSPECPPDGFEPASTECRAVAGNCDVPEFCTGTGPLCPTDVVEPAGVLCRPVAGDCDIEEVCDGVNPVCPPDVLEPASTICRPAVDACDVTENCTGSTPTCPPDGFQPLGTMCPGGVCNGSGTCGPCADFCPTRPNSSPTCEGGVCGYDCNPEWDDCNGVADDGCEVHLPSDIDHCNTCGNVCPTRANSSRTCIGGTCGFSCNAGYQNCDGNPSTGCEVHLLSDIMNCGTCSNICPTRANAATVCNSGTCGFNCNPGYTNCDGNPDTGCETHTEVDLNNCGACGNACPNRPNSSRTCSGGACGYTCDPNYGDCNGVASDGCEVDLLTNPSHCSACGASCPARANATTTCVGGTCSFTCNAGFADCDGDPSNGCEVNTTTNPLHCNGCGNACATPPNAVRTCVSSTCSFDCNTGFADCNGVAGDGCEVATGTDVNNCGTCNNSCPSRPNSTRTCSGGTCGYDCDPNYADCNGVASDGCEVHLPTNTSHCGACGNTCPARPNATTTCVGGLCGFVCNAGFADCDGDPSNGCEVNLATNAFNCGTCGNLCPNRPNAVRACVSSSCSYICNTGFEDCNGLASDGCEVATGSDVNNCGACGFSCPTVANATRTCVGGACGASCNTGFGNCDGNLGTGCETNLNTSVNNCGSCGFVCSVPNANPACSSGSCAVGSCFSGYFNVDGSVATGCECQDDTFPNVCGSAHNVGSLSPGQTQNRDGKVVPSGGEDWFVVSFPAQSPGNRGGTPTIDFTVNDGSLFRFDVRWGGCGGGSGGCPSGLTSFSFTDNVSDANGFTSHSVGWPSTIYVRVYRITSGQSCANYRMRFTR